MIEVNRSPVFRRVACGTVGAQRALVHIVLLMAARAVLRRGFEQVIGVARLTFNGYVFAGQLECRLTVIETDLFPTLRRVACGAVSAERALVRVVFDVTVNTRRWGVLEVGHRVNIDVALAARKVGVLA